MTLTSLLVVNTVVVSLYMSVWFWLSYRLKRLDVVDTAWGGGFMVIALWSYIESPHLQSKLLAVMVSAWGIRLAVHIASRNRGRKNDPRYDTLTAHWKARTYWLRAYTAIFLLQGLLVLLISVPVTVAATDTSSSIHATTVVGCLVWGIGLLIETIADYQLRRFLASRTPAHAIMERGLWRYSRHPNYFGEIVVWGGVALIASDAPHGWVAWLGPLVLGYLIIFISGIPPIEKRKKTDPAYQAYAQRTSVLVPLPPKQA